MLLKFVQDLFLGAMRKVQKATFINTVKLLLLIPLIGFHKETILIECEHKSQDYFCSPNTDTEHTASLNTEEFRQRETLPFKDVLNQK